MLKQKFIFIVILICSVICNISMAQTITVGTVSSASDFCAGESITVAYTKTGTFTGGNIFTAQLSDALGSFTLFTSIGTLTSTTNGTINCIIPLSSIAGSSYKIRVVSSTPVVISDTVGLYNITILPTVNAGLDVEICEGGTVLLAGSIGGSAVSAIWSGGGTFAPNSTTLNATFTPSGGQITAGIATLILTTNAGVCAAVKDTVIITINDLATADAGNDITICTGTTATMDGSFGGGASSASWTTSGTGTFNNASSMTAIYTPSAADVSAGTVTITLTTNNPTGPCNAATNTMVLTINPGATANAGVNQTICSGSTAPMSGSVGGSAGSGTWSSSGSGSFNNNASMTAVYTPSAADVTAGSVTITLTTNNPSGPCLAATDQMTLTISAGATANAGSNQTICAGSTATMGGSFGGVAISATWSSSGTGTFNNTALMNAVYTPSAADINAGSVIITLTTNDPVGTCVAATDQLTLTINAAAVANANVDQIICAGSTATMNGSFSGTGVTNGTWSTSGTGTFNNSTSMTAVYTPSAADILVINVTITLTTNDPPGACNAATNTMVVTINTPATVNAGIDQTICAGSTATMSGSFGGSATSALWSSSGVGTFNNTSLMNAVYTPSAADIIAGSVTITLTSNDPIGPCSAVNNTMILTINPAATANAGIDQTICAGFTATMNGSVGGGATTGTWTSSGTGTFNNASSMSAIYTPSAADITSGIVTITLTTNDPIGPCNAVNNTMVLTINPAPTVNAGVDQTICAGSTATMSGTFGGSASTTTWSTGGTGSFNNVSLLNAIYTPSAADISAGSVTLTLTTNDPAGVCLAVNNQMILTISPLAVSNAGVDQTICAGTNSTMNGSVSGGASTGTWTSSGTGTFNNATAMNAIYTPSITDITNGTVTITLTTNDPSGPCFSDTNQMTLTINEAAIVNAGSSQIICADDFATMNGSIGGSAATVTWSTSGNGTFDDINSLSAVYTPGSSEILSGSVTLTLTTDNPLGPCLAVTDTLIITILPLPIISVTSNSSEICSGDTTTLHVTNTGTTLANSFSWQPAGLLNSATGQDVVASVPNPGTFPITQTFTVVGSSSLGCTATNDITITINPLPAIPTILGKNSICAGEANVLYTISPPIQSTDIFSWSATPAGINAFVTVGNHDSCLVDFSGLAGGTTNCALTVTVTTTQFGCKSNGVKPITISGQAPPLEPVIEFSTNPFTLAVLYSQTSTSYRWGRDFISNFNQDTVGFNNEFGNQNLQLFLVPDTIATPLQFDLYYYWVEYYNDDINCKQKAYYNIDSTSMFQSLTSVQNKLIDAKKYFSIYPNPTDGIFIIHFAAGSTNQNNQLIIYDLNGREMENHLGTFDSNSLVVNANRNYPKGIYFVKIINQYGGCQISKIIIQ